MLSDDLKQLVEREFGETDAIRTHAINAMREWVLKNPKIVKARLDSKYILKYLRSKKFSLQSTQDLMETSLTVLLSEQDGVKLFYNPDFKLPEIQELLNSG